MDAVIEGRLKPALAVGLIVVYSLGGLLVVLVTGLGSHWACGSPAAPRGVLINLPLLICRHQADWASLGFGAGVGLTIGSVVVAGIAILARVGQPS